MGAGCLTVTVQTNTAGSLLSRINGAQDVRALPREALPRLCDEVRQCLIDTVSKTAGHLASGLGVVELTVALHYVFDTPEDILVWDVGHQAYPHKILTGHRDEFPTIRQPDGIHAFIWRNETPYDLISTGHASTSIGSALGLAAAQRFKPKHQRRKVIAIIGDGAISGGCAFEALNHAGSFKDLDLTVILNDNEWSISENVGSIAQGLSHIISNPHYVKLIEGGKRILKGLPAVRDLALRAQEHVKGMLMPGTLFEEFGFNYMGPVDGHDIYRLVNLLQNIKEMNGLNFLHIVTTKGKGYAPAEKDPTCYHGVPTFDPHTGIQASCNKEDLSYSSAFGRWLCDKAATDSKLVGITPAMRVGSGMSEFASKYPDQFFDVAIAEQHAMVFASGLAAGGMRPVVNIYSSFMQRAYDGLIHDCAIQDLPIILALDRGGIVGSDGPTHNGSFDIAYTRTVPNLVIMAPSSRRELYYMLNTAYAYKHPTVVRYPRANGESFSTQAKADYQAAHNGQSMLDLNEIIPIGQVECLRLATFHQALLEAESQSTTWVTEANALLESAQKGGEPQNGCSSQKGGESQNGSGEKVALGEKAGGACNGLVSGQTLVSNYAHVSNNTSAVYGIAQSQDIVSGRQQPSGIVDAPHYADELGIEPTNLPWQCHNIQNTVPLIKPALSLKQLLGLDGKSSSLYRAQPTEDAKGESVNRDTIKSDAFKVEAKIKEALEGRRIALLGFGPMAHMVEPLAEAYDFSVFNMRFIKPLNEQLIAYLAVHYDLLVTLEEGAVLGGIGEHVAALVAKLPRQNKAQVLTLGLPDQFIMEAPRDMLLKKQGLDNMGIMQSILRSCGVKLES